MSRLFLRDLLITDHAARRSRSRHAISQWCSAAHKTADTTGTRCARLAASSTSLPAVASAEVGVLDNQLPSALPPWVTVIPECHSERSEESLATSGPITHYTEMFESLPSCFAVRCSALLNMTALSSDGTLAQETTACTPPWHAGINSSEFSALKLHPRRRSIAARAV
jgi:hypothetical protein